jgi:TRAP-type C4-dicarboxylate transport system substrate-binding protein
MKKFLALSALFCALGVTAIAAPRVQDPYGRPQAWHSTLSADDQAQFDKYYAKWMDATRRNDRDDISENARKMQDIMTRYNIPTTVSFDQIASASAYPNGAYPASSWQGRLSPDDQKEFDKQYSKWMNATRKNDQEDVAESARKMQEIMARYSIPSAVPFAQVASGGAAVAYPAPVNGYPAYSYASAQQRLSGDDQHAFDKAYKKWVEARHKNHHEDIDENARKMQDIMARYNIPANVPFDQIASPGAANH